ncbi:MAG: hypothetical protein PHW76_01805 [Alphaproteobacteria bacterium]|nr:hypothetical protein [Alphaproteobacteria bacterium]
MEPVAYRVSEFCRIYVISKASFYREVQAGRLHILKRGRRSLVERTEAERWFDRIKAKANPMQEKVPSRSSASVPIAEK